MSSANLKRVPSRAALSKDQTNALVAAIVSNPTEQNFVQFVQFLNFEDDVPEFEEVTIINVQNEREGKNLTMEQAKEMYAILLKYAGQKENEDETTKLAAISFAALDLFTDLTIFGILYFFLHSR